MLPTFEFGREEKSKRFTEPAVGGLLGINGVGCTAGPKAVVFNGGDSVGKNGRPIVAA